ncbi:hypothetical protein R1flu_015042 [Riccia fluitans]|uniref:Ribosomal protein eL8/eL30/eS12/Gadd45 domain-containing protein n=1 Tax=Riccia fluitans TaxID=41844 RepID=A0ABD1YHT6_9MARC
MEKEFQRPISGKAVDLFLKSVSQALKDSGVNVEGENPDQNGGRSVGRNLKVHFCIGINSVTRTLERMPSKNKKRSGIAEKLANLSEMELSGAGKSKPETLQAIVVAVDVQPKNLVGHLGYLCHSRGVPMVSINGGDGMGSLRLGEVLGLKTAVVIGIKIAVVSDALLKHLRTFAGS